MHITQILFVLFSSENKDYFKERIKFIGIVQPNVRFVSNIYLKIKSFT